MNGDRQRMSWRGLRRAGIPAVLALLSWVTAAAAQDARGTIAGTVHDASKGVVPGAAVVVKHVEMGTTVSAHTNQDGLFEVPYLIPGAYEVTVELSGFPAAFTFRKSASRPQRMTLILSQCSGALQRMSWLRP